MDFARSLRPASMARCTGSSGGFASYRRDPLAGTYREGGAGDHVRTVECLPRLDHNVGYRTSDAACYNFLYCIEVVAKDQDPRGPPAIHHLPYGWCRKCALASLWLSDAGYLRADATRRVAGWRYDDLDWGEVRAERSNTRSRLPPQASTVLEETTQYHPPRASCGGST